MASSSPPLVAASASTSPFLANTLATPVVALDTAHYDQSVPPPQENSIVVPPVAPTAEPTTAKPAPLPTTISSENVDSCCSKAVAIGFLALGLIMFLIFVTIAGQLGQSDTAFCNGYVSSSTYSIFQYSTFLSLQSFFLIGSGAPAKSTSFLGMYVADFICA